MNFVGLGAQWTTMAGQRGFPADSPPHGVHPGPQLCAKSRRKRIWMNSVTGYNICLKQVSAAVSL